MSNNNHWTTENIPDQTGRVAIVTGANSGLGFETSKALAAKGAAVIMACRNVEKGNAAAEKIRGENPSGNVQVMQLDLADLDSIQRFAGAFPDTFDRLDLLTNNAGVMAIPQAQTANGFEMQFGTNHLGHFALTSLLIGQLLETSPNGRVVTVSSNTHRIGNIDLANLNAEKSYSRWHAYGLSKLANLLFAYELQRKLQAAGSSVISVAAHPGYSSTNLQGNSGIFSMLNPILAQSQEMGALPSLYAATEPEVNGGDYIGPSGFMEQRGYPRKVKSSDRSYDEATAARLWQVSEKLTGANFPV
ncbi:MAG: oxidoreductase [Chloroflexota bacterium]|nr:oxidoreductase [Chloroflexota bacterium]